MSEASNVASRSLFSTLSLGLRSLEFYSRFQLCSSFATPLPQGARSPRDQRDVILLSASTLSSRHKLWGHTTSKASNQPPEPMLASALVPPPRQGRCVLRNLPLSLCGGQEVSVLGVDGA